MGKLREQFEDVVRGLLPEKDQEDVLALIDAFDTRDELFQTLTDDDKLANEALQKNFTDQYLRRTFVRTNFAMMEGLLNVLTFTVIEASKSGVITLTKDEIVKLTEETITKTGEIRPKFLSVGKKVQFSFLIFAQKMGGFDYVLDTSTKEWKEFEAAIDVRNQLMHPRTIADLMITQEQLDLIYRASNWFISQYTSLQGNVGEMANKRSLENAIKARIKGIKAGK